MKKTKLSLLLACGMALTATGTMAQGPHSTSLKQMEKLDRGLVVIPNGTLGRGNFISWRMLGTDDKNVGFELYRNGSLIAGGTSGNPLDGGTCYVDTTGTANDSYSLKAYATDMSGTTVVGTAEDVRPWSGYYKKLQLQAPDPTVNNNDTLYYPNDCSVGDVDGDGQYEIIVKWDPQGKGPSKDNSQKGKTCNVVLDCYKLDGTRLWSINLGPNIRAGAHYTQFLVYDFDGDGKAEVMCKTAPGSKDGQGKYVTLAADDDAIKNADNAKSYRNSNGYVNDGPEYLTVFNGATGAAVNTVFYNPNRAGGLGGAPSHPSKSFWGDNYGGRADRYLATVAYLAGKDENPSAVFVRGYYTRSYFWAVDFDGSKLKTRWLHASTDKNTVTVTDADGHTTTTKHSRSTSGKGSATAFGNGNHNLSCADVDGDGKDEIIMGSCAIDDNGSLLYATGMGHGDAIHLGDLNPDRPGLEVFEVHEEKNMPYGWDVHDAATGEILFSAAGSSDNGRGMAADVMASDRGYEFWSSNDRSLRSAATGEVVSTKSLSQCFRLYWNGDLQDELFDGKYSTSTGKCSPQVVSLNSNGTQTVTEKINGYYFTDHQHLGTPQTCNTTKATPCLIADLFGDWREEIVMWDWSDKTSLDIYSTTIPTDYRIPTLMHDHTYRMGVAWQQTAYNQPAHLGYYLPDYAAEFTPAGISAVTTENGTEADANVYNVAGQRVGKAFKGLVIVGGKKVIRR